LEGSWFKATPGKGFTSPYLQDNQSKMDWRFGSSRVTALQAQSPEFKPQSHKKGRKKGYGDTMHLLLLCRRKLNTSYIILLPKIWDLNLKMRKQSYKSQHEDRVKATGLWSSKISMS
jgi:hypothetical protein